MKRFRKIFSRTLLTGVALLLLFPVVLTFLYSFFSPEEITEFLTDRGSMSSDHWMRLLLIPKMFSTAQYYTILFEDNGILQRMLLSCFYCAAILFGQALVIPAMAYALSAFRFKGRSVILTMLMVLMLLPFQVTMVPNMLMLRGLKLLDTVWAVILPMVFAPFYVFLLRQYMISVPPELYEAGELDGAGTFLCFFRITLPMCRSCICAAVVLSFADIWNMVEQPLLFLSHKPSLQPLSTVFNQLINEPSGIEFGGAVLYMLPALLIYLLFNEDIVSGLAAASIK